ncbi:MAG: erythromycin esterase family protein [Gemmatimonadales bacterium]
MRLTPVALSAFLLLWLPAPCEAQRPLNLGFEMRSVSYADRPWGWALGWSAFGGGPAASFVLDESEKVQGARSLRIVVHDSSADAPARALMLQVPAAFARGKVLRLTGQLRTKGLTGRALLILEAWGDRVVVSADTGAMRDRDADGRWQKVDLSISVPVDPSVHSVVIMTAVQGMGTAWFDALELRVAGKPLTALPIDPPPPTPAEIAWLTTRSAPLRDVRALPAGEKDDKDLALFSRIVGDARLVGLGESTHGTSEFFQVKERLVEFLVRTQGFDVFAVEANQLAVERVNNYVLGGSGAAQDVMRVMFRVWNTEEMRSLVEWMRAHNAAHPERPVRFIGYDMQDQRAPADTLIAFVSRAEPEFLPRVESLTSPYRAEPGYATPQVPDSTRALWLSRADSLWQEVETRRSRWLTAASSDADSIRVEWAVHAAALFRQAARLNASLNSPDRDSLMAANLDWSLRTLYPRSRVIVWAHDVHVSHGGDQVRSFNGGAQMGSYLKHAYGHEYRAFSLLTRTGRYSATRSFIDHEIIAAQAFPAPAGSVEAALARLPRPVASPGVIVDLRVAAEDPHAAWLWHPRPVRSIGYAAYDYGFDLTAAMPLEFDGVVFIDHTTPSRLLP